jgi:hypothetical protein
MYLCTKICSRIFFIWTSKVLEHRPRTHLFRYRSVELGGQFKFKNP